MIHFKTKSGMVPKPAPETSRIRSAVLLFARLLLPAVILIQPSTRIQAQPRADSKVVHIIPVSGVVEPAMATYLKRVVAPLLKDDTATLVLVMDTFGGQLDAAFDIVETICTIPRERTIAYVEKRAISAGALIALSAGTLIMRENTLIGDCAPIIQTSDGHKEAGEKIQTVLRAQFRTLAKRNNYPQVLAEAMVSKSMEVYKITRKDHTEYVNKTTWEALSETQKADVTHKTTIVSQGQLLTMDDKEAAALGFSRQSVTTLDQALGIMGYRGSQQVRVEENWSEILVRWLQPFLPILMLLGIGAVYTEIKAPGFGIPGIVGIICLGIVFFSQYLVGLADYTEFLLFIIVFLLLGVEILVLPGFGIAGVSAVIILIAGLVLSLQDFVLPDPNLPWQNQMMTKNLVWVMGIAIGAFLVSMSVIRFILPRISRVINGPCLDATLQDSHAKSANALVGIYAGDPGIAVTPLRPSGKVRMGGRKVDAVTQGDFIDPGTPIRVARITAGHLVVKTCVGIGKKEET